MDAMPPRETELARKASRLEAELRRWGRMLVAYSGGVDSAYLAWAAHHALREGMLAIIADSPSLARAQLSDALAFAREQAIPLEVVSTSELDREEYVRNDGQRCFQCKDELFGVLESMRAGRGFDTIAYGVNVDDEGDFRPGQQAAKLHHVAAPLFEAGLTKQDIRELARQAGLRVWDKPASACLSSRIAYGRPVTREALRVVEQGEEAIRALGFRQFRVRHHGEIVRIEIAREEMEGALTPAMAATFTAIFKRLGFKFVTLDLEGFRSGSMNALLSIDQIRRRG
jgi:pyridinium-3,5-biscarboxylic acid mononucleotide sulfurtransferase